MKNLIFPIAICSALFLSLPSFASFNDAVKNYESGNYEDALAEFRTLAEIGNKGAQYNLGMMYLDGLGTKQDLAKAFAWIKLSDEEDNNAETQKVLEQIIQHLDTKNIPLAKNLYIKINQQFGKSVILKDLTPIFDSTLHGDKRLLAKPIKTTPAKYPKLAQLKGIQGYTKVQFYLDKQGKPIEVKVLNSFPPKVFDKASLSALKTWRFEMPEEGWSSPMRYTLQFTLEGDYSEKVLNLVNKLKIEAENGNPVSQYYFAKYAPNILKDKSINASEWYFKAAQQGVADAQYELGLNLINGQGCIADKSKGLNWLTKAASGNLGRSQLKLSRLYSKSKEEGAKEKSQFWLEKALNSGDKEIALDVAAIISKQNDFDPQLVLTQLDLLDEENVSNILDYYELYALSFAQMNNYKQAVKFQTKANRIMRRYGMVPKLMREKLSRYKEKRDS